MLIGMIPQRGRIDYLTGNPDMGYPTFSIFQSLKKQKSEDSFPSVFTSLNSTSQGNRLDTKPVRIRESLK